MGDQSSSPTPIPISTPTSATRTRQPQPVRPTPLFGYKDIVTSISALAGHPENDGDTWEFMEYLYKDGGKEAYREFVSTGARSRPNAPT